MFEFKARASDRFPGIWKEKSTKDSIVPPSRIEKSIEKIRQTNINSILPLTHRPKKHQRQLWTSGNVMENNTRKSIVHIKVVEKLPKIQYLSHFDDVLRRQAQYSNNTKSRNNSIDYQDKILFLKLSHENIDAEERALLKTNMEKLCRYKIDGLKIRNSSSLESIPESECQEFPSTDFPRKGKVIDWRQPWGNSFISYTPASSKPSSLPTISE